MGNIKVVKLEDAITRADTPIYEVDEGELLREKFDKTLKISGYPDLRVVREPGASFVDVYIGTDEDESVAMSRREIDELVTLLEEARDHAV